MRRARRGRCATRSQSASRSRLDRPGSGRAHASTGLVRVALTASIPARVLGRRANLSPKARKADPLVCPPRYSVVLRSGRHFSRRSLLSRSASAQCALDTCPLLLRRIGRRRGCPGADVRAFLSCALEWPLDCALALSPDAKSAPVVRGSSLHASCSSFNHRLPTRTRCARKNDRSWFATYCIACAPAEPARDVERADESDHAAAVVDDNDAVNTFVCHERGGLTYRGVRPE